MIKSMLDQFSKSESPHTEADIGGIIHRCKETLYHFPTGRRLIDVLNTHRIPVTLERAEEPGYTVLDHTSIILKCPVTSDLPIVELSFHLACAIRAVELHIQNFLSPDMQDSRSWLHPHLKEPFEVMLIICKLASDMNANGPKPEVQAFLAKKNCEKIYHAYEQKMPYSHLEELMIQNFNHAH